jgi:hypothetical protein
MSSGSSACRFAVIMVFNTEQTTSDRPAIVPSALGYAVASMTWDRHVEIRAGHTSDPKELDNLPRVGRFWVTNRAGATRRSPMTRKTGTE